MTIRDLWTQAIKATGHPRAQEYISECEHQDGYGFWDNFNHFDEVIEDFDRYCGMATTNTTPVGDGSEHKADEGGAR